MAINKQVLNTALVLGTCAFVCVGLLSMLHMQTQTRIAANRQTALLKGINELVPKQTYDNDLFKDTIQLYSLPLFGVESGVIAYRARKQGRPVALIFPLTARNGYSGNIKLLLAIHHNGRIAGVRVLEHRETPGLGDAIEKKKSDWILGFNNKSIDDPPLGKWAVKPDGGAFDAFTGATITPRAVVDAIKQALQFYAQHRDRLWEQQT